MKLLRKMLPIITPVVAGLAAMIAPSAAQAAWTQASNYTPSGAAIAAGAAGSQLGTSGWYDNGGGVWSVDGNGNLVPAASGTAANIQVTRQLYRAPSENSTQPRVTFNFLATSQTAATNNGTATYAFLRANNASNGTGYILGCGSGQLQAYRIVNGTSSAVAAPVSFSYAGGTNYKCDLSVVKKAGATGTSTVNVTLFSSDGTTQLATLSADDTTAALQDLSGAVAIYQYAATTPNNITNLATFAQTATGYVLSGPGAGRSGAASPNFSATLNGILGSVTAITPSDGGNGGSFSPSTVSIPAGQSTATFTYTAASTGAKTISSTNNQSLTDPAALTYQSLILIPTTSAAMHFSPGNWQCYGQRACASGVTSPRTMQAGAYFCVAWNASSTPNAILALSNNPNAMKVSYFLNGVLVDNVAATNTLTLSPTANTTNQLMVVMRSIANPALNIWGQTGSTFYGMEVDGLLVDSSSSAGIAPAPCQPTGRTDVAFKGWGLIQGDSIRVGYNVDGYPNDNYLHSNIWYAWQQLFAQGYEFGTVATSGSGVAWQGAATDNFVPGLYVVNSTGYRPSISRWNLVDAGISMLDANGHISAYGATGTEPALVANFNAGNDAANGVTPAYTQAAIPGLLGATRAAAPNAKMIFVPDEPLVAGTLKNSATMLTAVRAGAAAYTGDPNFTYAETGPLASLVYNSSSLPSYRTDESHPNSIGNAMLAPGITSLFQGVLTPPPTAPFRGTFH